MSNKSWQNSIRKAVNRCKQPPKIAVIGIGHELRGDDAAGLAVVHLLNEQANLLVIEAGTSPENHTGKLRRFQPDLVLLIDAAQMDLEPGEICVLDPESLDGFGASTHTMPLTLIAHYLSADFGCEVLLIGIQPAQTCFGAPLSPQVKHSTETISRELEAL